uniref:40S ribosomal protein S4 n=1 Tax=Aureoumbra lagunensis TaxID=44058 RepID=A0A6S8EVA2_9STRA|eukprot:CAMPEP_0197289606 /NCGR_PEP_ID=MMETSP0890-20130614/6858_1 /TAXON_ID=44058 ORGANISM="Aureoumbra lagunensis, Strain CCMP1510" /NCGR_SAMPLE_ID=MMETSP0890 /ASSEMBLY_ACC=CAM_ASM_000533 /LENGTH=263 /DNA_ID=CAMNT_0042761103 /DNA_START=22 /DNA_END=813 /DNA_ORIENTATION=-
MGRGPKKHLKRVNAPKHWMLGKMDGAFAPRPSTGPHKLRECLPLVLILRNRLKYAITGQEAKMICMEKCVKVDGKVRTDPTFPAGFMDVIELEKSGDQFRLMYDTKGRFSLHALSNEEKKFKLCRVNAVYTTAKKIPVLTTHDGRTVRYPDPLIKVNDVIKLSIVNDDTHGKILSCIKFEIGAICTITKGRNTGRNGTIVQIERHPGSFDVVTVKDAAGHNFATRLQNIFVLGKDEPEVSLPKGKGIKLTILEERAKRIKTSS